DGPELRLQQEIVLGIGGWRLLSSLGIEPAICHLNEGHAALAVLERARDFMTATGQSFEVALTATRSGNIFTTHTPVEAGFDRFQKEMAEPYLAPYAEKLGISYGSLLALGRQNPGDDREPLNMAYLAVRGAGAVNAVSRLHCHVSRNIFQPLFPRIPLWEIPVTYVTNGVHVPSWDSALADTLWTDACGQYRWQGDLETLEENMKGISPERFWMLRDARIKELISYVRQRYARQLAAMGAPRQDVSQCAQLLDAKCLTVGFARRFTGYKRPNLLLQDPERLVRLLTDPERSLQLIIAGKAHPNDREGKEMIKAWARFTRRPEVRPRVIFLEDYDMSLAQKMVQGVDLWINTPRRPWEACGTSGMKVLVNGGLNLSEIDGWWAEAYRPEVGWALGDGREHDSDPAWDVYEAGELYRILEEEVIPCFYERDRTGVPILWAERMRRSMAELTPAFSSNRMVREYVEKLYFPALAAFRERTKNEAQAALQINLWRRSIETLWPQIAMRNFYGERRDEGILFFRVEVALGGVHPGIVAVQLWADPLDDETFEVQPMKRSAIRDQANNVWGYEAEIKTQRALDDYTPRVVPYLPGAMVPLEAPQILWYK
ncbi:MAG: alpha-glucan family phosphorylase, partial [Smithellaceae bacterium]|nr:alpha-glucan family phosphorylase [Smithellaceae bacterium]